MPSHRIREADITDNVIEPIINVHERLAAFEKQKKHKKNIAALNRTSIDPIDLKQRIRAYENQRIRNNTEESSQKRTSIAPIDLRQRIQAYENQKQAVGAERQNLFLPNVDLRQRVVDYEHHSARPAPNIYLINPSVDLESLRIAAPDRARDLYEWQARQPAPNRSNIVLCKRAAYGPNSRFYTQNDYDESDRKYNELNKGTIELIVPLAVRVANLEQQTRPFTRQIKTKANHGLEPLRIAANIDRAKELFNWQSRKPVRTVPISYEPRRIQVGPTSVFYGHGWNQPDTLTYIGTQQINVPNPMQQRLHVPQLPYRLDEQLRGPNVHDYKYTGPIYVPQQQMYVRREVDGDSVERYVKLPVKTRKMQFEMIRNDDNPYKNLLRRRH